MKAVFVCQLRRGRRSGRGRGGGSGAGVKYCAGRTTDPNTALQSLERRGNEPQEPPPEERERAPSSCTRQSQTFCTLAGQKRITRGWVGSARRRGRRRRDSKQLATPPFSLAPLPRFLLTGPGREVGTENECKDIFFCSASSESKSQIFSGSIGPVSILGMLGFISSPLYFHLAGHAAFRSTSCCIQEHVALHLGAHSAIRSPSEPDASACPCCDRLLVPNLKKKKFPTCCAVPPVYSDPEKPLKCVFPARSRAAKQVYN